ncbi:MAG: elongation factor P, partial [Clostridiales bacterium]|nr:elongation factor P [Clostridiales bacterium]
MAQILAGDIRKGVTFEYKSGTYTVTEFQHVKPGKGAAFVRCTLKNVVTGQVLSNETFNPTAKLETAEVQTTKMTYSYFDGEFYVF